MASVGICTGCRRRMANKIVAAPVVARRAAVMVVDAVRDGVLPFRNVLPVINIISVVAQSYWQHGFCGRQGKVSERRSIPIFVCLSRTLAAADPPR